MVQNTFMLDSLTPDLLYRFIIQSQFVIQSMFCYVVSSICGITFAQFFSLLTFPETKPWNTFRLGGLDDKFFLIFIDHIFRLFQKKSIYFLRFY